MGSNPAKIDIDIFWMDQIDPIPNGCIYFKFGNTALIQSKWSILRNLLFSFIFFQVILVDNSPTPNLFSLYVYEPLKLLDYAPVWCEFNIVTRELSTQKKSWIIRPDSVGSIVGLLNNRRALTSKISTCYNLILDINQWL